MQEVIITGGSRGLGKAIGEYFAKKGKYHIALIAQNEERLALVKNEFEKNYDCKVSIFAYDLSNNEALNSLIPALQKSIPNPSYIFNNLGLFTVGKFEESSTEALHKLLQLNCLSAIAIVQAFYPVLKKQKGHVFNIGSIVSKYPKKEVFNYTISKAAMHYFTLMLREEAVQHGIKVSEIIPGSVNTSSWDGEDVPKEEFIQCEDIVQSIDQILQIGNHANIEEVFIRPSNRNF